MPNGYRHLATNYDFHQIKTTLHDVEREKSDTLLKQNRNNNNEPIGNVARAKKRLFIHTEIKEEIIHKKNSIEKIQIYFRIQM